MIPAMTVGATAIGALLVLSSARASPDADSASSAEILYVDVASAGRRGTTDPAIARFMKLRTDILLNDGEEEANTVDAVDAAARPKTIRDLMKVYLYVMVVAGVAVASCQANGEIDNVKVDKRQRRKGYCSRLVASVAHHQTTVLKRGIRISAMKENAAARACYRKVFESERDAPSKRAMVEFDSVRPATALAPFLVPARALP
jgi:ribosomal protein S18 acetylase RimI-like enzyme